MYNFFEITFVSFLIVNTETNCVELFKNCNTKKIRNKFNFGDKGFLYFLQCPPAKVVHVKECSFMKQKELIKKNEPEDISI